MEHLFLTHPLVTVIIGILLGLYVPRSVLFIISVVALIPVVLMTVGPHACQEMAYLVCVVVVSQVGILLTCIWVSHVTSRYIPARRG